MGAIAAKGEARLRQRFKAPRHRRIPGTQNKLEAAYHAHLQEMKDKGEILFFSYEGLRLKLAQLCTYTPDFVVLMPNGELHCHEVKGGIWVGDARVKFRLAAETFPFFRFCAVTRAAKKDGGNWIHEWLP